MTKFVMNIFVMKNLLKNARIQKGLKIREVAQLLDVDQALVSKFESGNRIPTRLQLSQLAQILDLSLADLQKEWLKIRILNELEYEEYAEEAINMVQEALQLYKKTHKPIISDYLKQLLQEIDFLKNILQQHRETDSFRIAQALELEYTFESNRIEGNTLTLQETDLVVNEGLTISGKSMREHLEVINHSEAIDFVKDMVQNQLPFSERTLLQIHQLILKSIQSDQAGKYRSVQVMITGSQHVPPQPYLIQLKMEELFDFYVRNKQTLHPVLMAAEMHEQLVTVHPFIDGNGRTSRLIMNLILLQNGYVIANLKGDSENRLRYYKALETAQINQSKESFHVLVAEAEKDALTRYLHVLGVSI